MNLRISDILAHVCEQDLYLLELPTEDCREEAQSEALKSVFELDQIPCSDGFLGLC
jgi:hypothetical protein